MLQIVTFKYGTKYTAEHVLRLQSMINRNLNIPFQFCVVTDTPEEFRGWELRVIPLWKELREARNCGVRLKTFSEEMREVIGARFCVIDLDVVIVADVTKMFSRPESFVIVKTPRPPLFYNASLVMMDAGSRANVYHDLGKSLGEYQHRCAHHSREVKLGFDYISDEAWIAATLGPDEATWDQSDGIYYYRNHIEPNGGGLPEDARIVLMNGKRFDPSKPEWHKKSPWILEHWR